MTRVIDKKHSSDRTVNVKILVKYILTMFMLLFTHFCWQFYNSIELTEVHTVCDNLIKNKYGFIKSRPDYITRNYLTLITSYKLKLCENKSVKNGSNSAE